MGTATVVGFAWTNMLGQVSPNAPEWVTFVVQGGGLVVVAAIAYYLFAKIIPSAMKQRQDEQSAFITMMQNVTSQHNEALKQAYEAARSERRDMERERIESDKQFQAKMEELTKALNEMSKSVRGCSFNCGPDRRSND